jgi:hypothetical protein
VFYCEKMSRASKVQHYNVNVLPNLTVVEDVGLTHTPVSVSAAIPLRVTRTRSSTPHANVNVLLNHTAVRDIGSTHTPVSVSAAILLRVTINTPSTKPKTLVNVSAAINTQHALNIKSSTMKHVNVNVLL